MSLIPTESFYLKLRIAQYTAELMGNFDKDKDTEEGVVEWIETIVKDDFEQFEVTDDSELDKNGIDVQMQHPDVSGQKADMKIMFGKRYIGKPNKSFVAELATRYEDSPTIDRGWLVDGDKQTDMYVYAWIFDGERFTLLPQDGQEYPILVYTRDKDQLDPALTSPETLPDYIKNIHYSDSSRPAEYRMEFRPERVTEFESRFSEIPPEIKQNVDTDEKYTKIRPHDIGLAFVPKNRVLEYLTERDYTTDQLFHIGKGILEDGNADNFSLGLNRGTLIHIEREGDKAANIVFGYDFYDQRAEKTYRIHRNGDIKEDIYVFESKPWS